MLILVLIAAALEPLNFFVENWVKSILLTSRYLFLYRTLWLAYQLQIVTDNLAKSAAKKRTPESRSASARKGPGQEELSSVIGVFIFHKFRYTQVHNNKGGNQI